MKLTYTCQGNGDRESLRSELSELLSKISCDTKFYVIVSMNEDQIRAYINSSNILDMIYGTVRYIIVNNTACYVYSEEYLARSLKPRDGKEL